MKRIASFLLAVTALASCSAAFAQEEAPAEQTAEEQIVETVEEEPSAEEIVIVEETAEEAAEEAEPEEAAEEPADAEAAEEPMDAEAAAEEIAEEPAEAEAEIAYSGTCGENVTWTFDASAGVLTISGTGAMYDFGSSGSVVPWLDYEDELYKVIIENGVTSIGDAAFCDCSELTDVTIPGSVRSIGDSAFSQCGLIEIEIPNGVTSIGEYAFFGCYGISDMTIPNSVTSIGDYAFSNFSALRFTFGGTTLQWRSLYGPVNGCTVRCIDGYYTLSTSGTGWAKVSTDVWVYLDTDGTMYVNRWLNYNGSWYFLGKDGAMVTGLVRLGDYGSGYVEYDIEASKAPNSVRTYYFSDSGKMLSGWQKIGGTWYYFNNARVSNQWVKYNGSWYYFDNNGAMVTGTVTTANGTTHNFASNGKWLGAA